MRQVFISRDLREESLFKTILEREGFSVEGLSLIQFFPLAFEAPQPVDWLFFYSKKGLQFFFEGLSKEEQHYFSNKAIATLGKSTRKAAIQLGLEVAFSGDGNAQNTSVDFLKFAMGKRVLFPRAAQSLKSVQAKLEEKVEVLDLIVYENVPKTNFSVKKADYLVFTSPMNARTYFKKRQYLPFQKVVAIGTTTEQALKYLGLNDVICSPEPSEIALATLIIQDSNH